MEIGNKDWGLGLKNRIGFWYFGFGLGDQILEIGERDSDLKLEFGIWNLGLEIGIGESDWGLIQGLGIGYRDWG